MRGRYFTRLVYPKGTLHHLRQYISGKLLACDYEDVKARRFFTVEEGIKVHRATCPNAIEMRSNYDYRLIIARWVSKGSIDFIAYLSIKGIDRIGLMNNVTKVISAQMNVNIKAVNIKSNDGLFEGEITLKIHNVNFLNSLIKKLKKIDGIQAIERSYKLD